MYQAADMKPLLHHQNQMWTVCQGKSSSCRCCRWMAEGERGPSSTAPTARAHNISHLLRWEDETPPEIKIYSSPKMFNASHVFSRRFGYTLENILPRRNERRKKRWVLAEPQRDKIGFQKRISEISVCHVQNKTRMKLPGSFNMTSFKALHWC